MKSPTKHTSDDANLCKVYTKPTEETPEPLRYIPCLDRKGNIYYLHPITLERLDRVTP